VKDAREGVARLLPAALLGIVAFTLVLEITEPPSPGLDPDAVAYLGAAESLATNLEYRVPSADWSSADSTAPLAHFPPGYSTALALPVRLGMAPLQAARLVQAIAGAVMVATLVLLVGGATTPLAGILAAVALFVTPAMHDVYVSVLSEPLFLACVVLTLAAMTLAPDRPLRMGIAAALAALTRYAGMSLVGAVALWQLARPGPLALRVRRAFVAVLPALVLEGAWVIRTHYVAGSSAIRRIGVYGDLAPTAHEARDTLRDWIVPALDSWPVVPSRGYVALAVGVLLLLVAGSAGRRARGLSLARRADDRLARAPVDAWRLLRAGALLLVCYLAMIVVSRLVADAHIPFDERILSPAIVLATAIVATALGLWWRGWRGAYGVTARLLLAAALLAWCGLSAAVTYAQASYVRKWGSDFAASEWRRSALLDWARTQGVHTPLYTNWPAAVYFHLHRSARELPASDDPRELAELAATVRAHGGRILAFSVRAPDVVTKETLVAQPGLRVIAALEDGVVLAPR
jgi:hypothetical protein